ncbi:MAG: hypothetical protein HQL37_08315, partial [Alphaproteobacteria bacterium]|nr:hypothetical protein [Alphaproteobacteria bacterium]
NRVPIIALTADAMADHRDRYFAAGVNDLVEKPIDWDILLVALDAYTKAGASDHIADGVAPLLTLDRPAGIV